MPNHVTNILKFSGPPKSIHKMLVEIKKDSEPFGSIDFNKIIPEPETMGIESGSTQTTAVSFYMSSINPDNEDIGYEKMTKEKYTQTLTLIKKHFPDCNDKMPIDEMLKESKEYFERKKSENTIDNDDLFQYGKIVVDNILTYGCKDWYEWRCQYWGTKWNSYDSPPQDPDTLEISFNTAWAAPHPVIEKLALMYPYIGIHHKWADEDIGSNTGYAEYNTKFETGEPEYLDGNEALAFAADVLGYDLGQFYIEHGHFIDLCDLDINLSEIQMKMLKHAKFPFEVFPEVFKTKEKNLGVLSNEKKKEFLEEAYKREINLDFLLYH